MTYPIDNGRLIFFLIASVVLAIIIFITRKKTLGGYKEGLILLSIGIFGLLISIVGICSTEGHWDSDFILAFLSFKIVSPKIGMGGFYYLRAMGYFSVMWGIAALIFGSRRESTHS